MGLSEDRHYRRWANRRGCLPFGLHYRVRRWWAVARLPLLMAVDPYQCVVCGEHVYVGRIYRIEAYYLCSPFYGDQCVCGHCAADLQMARTRANIEYERRKEAERLSLLGTAWPPPQW